LSLSFIVITFITAAERDKPVSTEDLCVGMSVKMIQNPLVVFSCTFLLSHLSCTLHVTFHGPKVVGLMCFVPEHWFNIYRKTMCRHGFCQCHTRFQLDARGRTIQERVGRSFDPYTGLWFLLCVVHASQGIHVNATPITFGGVHILVLNKDPTRT